MMQVHKYDDVSIGKPKTGGYKTLRTTVIHQSEKSGR